MRAAAKLLVVLPLAIAAGCTAAAQPTDGVLRTDAPAPHDVIEVAAPPAGKVLFRERFGTKVKRLATNSYAFWKPTDEQSVHSKRWAVRSGSLFDWNGVGWTGLVDDVRPDAKSRAATGSAIFRLRSRKAFAGDIAYSLRFKTVAGGTNSRIEAREWDGAHLWARYQAYSHLYVASIERRDGTVVIKKKCRGGSSAGGTYYSLTSPVAGRATPNHWNSATLSVADLIDGSVSLHLEINGRKVLSAIDDGVGCAPLREVGAIGVRADNTQFAFDDVSVVRRRSLLSGGDVESKDSSAPTSPRIQPL